MAKHIENKIVRFEEFTDADCNPIDDWHRDFLGLEGMLCIYASEHKAPGKRFVYFYPNEPDTQMQRYFNSTSGELYEVRNKLILITNHRYVFSIGDYVSEEERELLWLNIFMR